MSYLDLAHGSSRVEARVAAAAFQAVCVLVGAAANAAARKAIIMTCREAGAISAEAASFLVQTFQLEDA